MKKIITDLGMVLFLTAIMLLTGFLTGGWWWGFVLPVAAMGCFFGVIDQKLPSFFVGFAGGFLYWAGMNLYVHAVFHGIIFAKFTIASGWLMLFISGLAAGILSGVAIITGKTIGLIWRFYPKRGNLERRVHNH